jgi:hypothetical protein
MAAPYWAIAAREYLERWAHHLQVRRALALDPGKLGAPPHLPMAASVVAHAVRQFVASLQPAPRVLTLDVGGAGAWSYARVGDAEEIVVLDGRADDADATVRIDVSDAATLLSRGYDGAGVQRALRVDAEPELARAVAAFFARVLSS